MANTKENPVFDCQKCASCCKKGQTIELHISELAKMSQITKLKIDIRQTLEYDSLLWNGVVCELLQDCGNLTVLPDGRYKCSVYNTPEMFDACANGQPGWQFCRDAIESRKDA